MTAPPEPRKLLVADSFRVRDHADVAQVRGFAHHLARFSGTVREAFLDSLSDTAAHRHAQRQAAAEQKMRDSLASAGRDSELIAAQIELPDGEATRLDAFIEQARHRIAAFGAGFPRLELWRTASGPEYALSLRPMPQLSESLAMRSVSGLKLTHPDRKGPNIGTLTALNRELEAEALLLDTQGRALEGATTSLIYWADDSAESGHIISNPNRVRSITESLISNAASRRLVGVAPHRRRTGGFTLGAPTPKTLQQSEVWAVNALHGIRPVTEIDGVPLPAPVPGRLQWFREALDRCWETVASLPAAGPSGEAMFSEQRG